MKNNFLSDFPGYAELKKQMNGKQLPVFREANCHIHTPYSFSAFDGMQTIFSMAEEEKISVLGINDFFVTDGYESFHDGCLRYNIFPLFNIEFIGLMREEQKKGIRINDPNNPGRIYFCGKGLDFPYTQGWIQRLELKRMRKKSQDQMRAMIDNLNRLLSSANSSLKLTYEDIKKRYARNLVRERHLAKAIRYLAAENYAGENDQLVFLEKLYGGKKSGTGISDPSALENEIRSNLLKAGGAAFVKEDDESFPDLRKIIRIITNAGGIPCYPVLLDDPSGKCTEFENDPEKLHFSLSDLGIGSIELIPGRNDPSALKEFVKYFDKQGYLVTFGTEHNTPGMVPLTICDRNSRPLDESLKRIAWKGACVIAAHQYLRAHGRQGYVLNDGKVSRTQKEELSELGNIIIEYFLNNRKK
ncbi:MAG TPA: hypothetical protein PK719_05625 [Bacteroidales bacterium]|nr:hypothetical protein [Bacteroidales bacterium]OQB64141.1 MAG: hypothetical protein BWX96_00915 [Bacteroidetes bacterium ADurb.Bin145]HOU02781.1 hypothetical protein [Bacteroidales bacterium]HQG63114.1 hypothetical protein [Bacteroidales bacterium]HQK67966.1 hypothetical protein [Bacteroidales bacterium]